MFQVNSPFTSLSDVMQSPAMQAAGANQAASGVLAATNPYAINKGLSLNRGMSRGLGPSMQQQGFAWASRNAAPMQQTMQDDFANAQWKLQKATANEGYGAQMLSNLFRNYNLNNDPTPGFVAQRFGMQMLPIIDQASQQLGGGSYLSSLFGS